MKHLRNIFLFCFIASLVGVLLASTSNDVDAQDADKGKALFKDKGCVACHKIGGGDGLGPDLKGVLDKWADHDLLVKFIVDLNSVPDDTPHNSDHKTVGGLKAKYPLAMPVGSVNETEAKDILAYISGGEGLETKVVEVATGDDAVALGLKYFTGEKSFKNGAPSCISCHTVTVSGEMLFGGGSLASNVGSKYESLNHAWKRNGGDGMAAVIQNPQFLVMREVFAGKPLTDEEAGAITAFLGQVHKDNKGEEDSNTGMIFLFFILALLATGGVIFFFDRIWAKRFRDVRKPLVGEIE